MTSKIYVISTFIYFHIDFIQYCILKSSNMFTNVKLHYFKYRQQANIPLYVVIPLVKVMSHHLNLK